jgi:hypothetical protein
MMLLEEWISREQVTRHEDRDPCLLALADLKHKCPPRGRCLGNSPGYPASIRLESFAVLDYPEWWRDAQGNFICTAHPYDLGDLGALFKWGEANGIAVEAYPPAIAGTGPARRN